MPISNRMVVFGAVLTGAYELAEALQKYLEQRGIVNPKVKTYKMFLNIEDGFYGILRSANEIKARKPKPEPSLPKGVIAFPQMRDWGETVKTPIDFIQALCEKHGVPFVIFEIPPTLEQLGASAALFLPEPH